MDRETADEIKRHFNVVAEALRSEIRTVAEGVGANTDRLDSLDERLDGLEGRLDRFEARFVEEVSEVKAMIRVTFGQHLIRSVA
jgi:ubiquinone biosynthesis protein UbiJ